MPKKVLNKFLLVHFRKLSFVYYVLSEKKWRVSLSIITFTTTYVPMVFEIPITNNCLFPPHHRQADAGQGPRFSPNLLELDPPIHGARTTENLERTILLYCPSLFILTFPFPCLSPLLLFFPG